MVSERFALAVALERIGAVSIESICVEVRRATLMADPRVTLADARRLAALDMLLYDGRSSIAVMDFHAFCHSRMNDWAKA